MGVYKGYAEERRDPEDRRRRIWSTTDKYLDDEVYELNSAEAQQDYLRDRNLEKYGWDARAE